jgi:hypothetical protein
VRTLNNREESAAGEVLANLLLQETMLMLRVLERMSPGRIAVILETMESDVATRIFIMMSIDQPQFEPLLPPYLPELQELLAPPPVTPATQVEEPDEDEDEPDEETEPGIETDTEEDEDDD